MSSPISVVLPIAEAHRSARSGPKAVNLSKVIAARFDVPRGFVISSDAYQWHVWTSGVQCPAEPDVEAEQRERLRAAILGYRIADDIWSAVEKAYNDLALQCGSPEPKVAVRSSALQDFAGAYDSYLNVTGLEALNKAIKCVWASVWNGRAAAFRARLGTAGEPAMAVIVQQMVERPFSGSVTTANPVTGNPNRVLVSCESASGQPEHFELDLADLSSPSLRTGPGGGSGAVEPGDSLAALVAERAVLMEDVFNSRVEVEWAHDGERLWILQAQPLVGVPHYFPVEWPDAGDASLDWHGASTEPVSPLAASVLWGKPRVRSGSFASRRGKEKRCLVNGCAYRHRAGTDEADEKPDAARTQAREIARGLALLQTRRKELTDLHATSGRIIASDLSAIDRPALVRELTTAADTSRQAVELFDESWYPSLRFPRLLRDFLGSGTETECLYQRLLAGLAESTIMRDAKLQDLGDRFAAAKRSGKLDDSAWRRAFRRDVDAFAREYGYAFQHGGQAYDPGAWRSWVEDADPLFHVIGALARRGRGPSLVTLHSARQSSARKAEKEAEGMLEGRAASHFRSLLDLSRGWLDLRSGAENLCALAAAALRLVAIEIGSRLAESGVLSSAQDVFFLRIEDVAAVPAKPVQKERRRLPSLLARRKHEIWLQGRLAAPAALPLAAGTGAVPARSGAHGPRFRGRALSAGSATGRARIARTVAEAGDIERGEILIVPSPSSVWTAFFGIAGGFVSEEDEGASIGSIALDYGIPAVVGCAGITAALSTGDEVTVDGSTGAVESRAQGEPTNHTFPREKPAKVLADNS